MRKKAILVLSLIFLLVWSSHLPLAAGGKITDLTLRDGKVNADIYQVSLREVVSEIEKNWGIKVEVFGKVDQERMISAKFEDLPLQDSLYRLFRGTNFFYIEGGKLFLLGFGEAPPKKEVNNPIITASSSSTQGADRGKGSPLAPGASGIHKGTSQPAVGSQPSITRGEKKGVSGKALVEDKSDSADKKLDQTAEIQNPGEINQSKNSKSNPTTSFTTPIILEAGGQNISALSSDLSYDPNVLSNPRVVIGESGRLAEKEVVLNVLKPGLLRVGVIGLNQKVIPDGTVVNVTFDVVKDGQMNIKNQATASDPNGRMVPVRIQDGRIKAVK